MSAVAAPLLLLLFHTFFGNVQINYNALTVSVYCCLPSPSLSVAACLVSMPASGFHFKQNTIRLMRVIYAIYPPYVCTWMSVFELLGGFAMNVRQKAGKLSAHFTFCFISRDRGRKPPQIRNNETQLRLAT